MFSPALERQETPVHSVSALLVPNVTDFAGEMVRHSVDVVAFGPRLESISQLMFFEGEKNSVLVGVWGASVPNVRVVVDVPDPDVVDVDDLEVVDEELEGEGLLEQAASASAQAGRTSRRTNHVRSARGIRRVYDSDA